MPTDAYGSWSFPPDWPENATLADRAKMLAARREFYLAGQGSVQLTYAELLAWVEAVIQPDVPESITRQQFYEALANRGIITEEQAEAALQGVIPPALLTAVTNNLGSAAARYRARMALLGWTTFRRDSPLILNLMTAAQADGLFRAGALL